MVYALVLAAALVSAVGEVVQQRLARQAPAEDNLSPRLVLWLARRPRWLAGVGCTAAGDLLFSAALAFGSVVLVEAVFAVRLVFALVIAAAWGWHRVPRRDVLGALVLTVGLAAFLLAAHPGAMAGGSAAGLRWVVGAAAVVVVSGVLTLTAARLTGAARALLLGLAAGPFFGLQAALMQRSVRILVDSGVGALATTWSGYAIAGAALIGTLLAQSAFNAAPLTASYPGLVATQLLSSIALGIGVLGGSGRLEAADLATGVAALLAMLGGVVALARSPLVTGGAAADVVPGRG